MQFHGNGHKRKISGGKKRHYRKKRAFEMGREFIKIELGTTSKKLLKGFGKTKKIKLLNQEYANVTDSISKKTKRAKILRVLRNPVNIDYDRRKIMTKSTIIETDLGKAIVTSRPGQNGLINAILIDTKTQKK